jgi:hypothetical protein
MQTVLSSQYYTIFPLATDVSTWEISMTVNFGGLSGLIVGTVRIFDLDCWECEIDDETSVYYDSASGIFVSCVFLESDITNPQNMQIHSEHITLIDFHTEGLEGEFFQERGVFVTGILIELAIIVWLISERRKK